MHFSKLAVAAACLTPFASAQDAAEAIVEQAVAIDRPDFTPTNLKAPFLEQFTDDWESRWSVSNAKKVNDQTSEEEWQFVGTWAAEEPIVFKGIEGDKGLVLKDKAAHHAISAKFPKAIDPKKKQLVVQYEVKLQEGLECGGAYMKLLKDTKALKTEEFSNASPYVVMFGPDKCGSTNKVHFIFKHKNPKTGEYEEKHMMNPPQIVNEKTTSLYQLVVNPDQTFTISVNGENMKNGSFFEDFMPRVNPEKEIDDEKDVKPADWVEMARIEDPEATKPEDWNEDAPFQIPDETAEKPEDWLDDEPLMVPDPEAQKPEDWDDEEDGDWVPPQVPNPKCAEASGCGPWERPMIKNPEYKGPWKAPMIENPAFKGIWKPRKIANPNYFDDKTPANLEPIGAIGFELWTMQNNILFDNIYIGHSLEDANKLKAETFDVKYAVEQKEVEAAKPPPSAEDDYKPKSPLDLSFTADPITYIKEKVELFITLAQRDPMEAIRFVPEVAGAIGVLIVTLMAAFVMVGGGAAAQSPAVQDAAKKAKTAAVDAKDKTVEAVSTGAEKAQAEINKRTTRSGGS